MWLRDSLRKDLPGTRILLYGYDTRLLHSESVQSIRDLANQFRNSIRLIRLYDMVRESRVGVVVIYSDASR